MFETAPDILLNPPQKVSHFLDDFTASFGPLFIVLDEIGGAFESDVPDDFDAREKFMSFCDAIVRAWLTRPEVFFLLLGRGAFLSYVGLRPMNIQSNYCYERLNIHLLRSDAIMEILEHTYVDVDQTRTIQVDLNLDRHQMEQVSRHLFGETSGRPRSLLKALIECKTFEQLIHYSEPIETADWESTFCQQLILYGDQVMKLVNAVESHTKVDLTTLVTDSGGKTMTLDIIANNSCIAWEGASTDALLYMHPLIKAFANSFTMPFRQWEVYKKSRSIIQTFLNG